MKDFDFFLNFKYVIFPDFYTVKDLDDNEYVFLKTDEKKTEYLKKVADKTQLEAYENHVHLFGKLRKNKRDNAAGVAKLILENLVKQLKIKFPEKKFHVYLDCDYTDHVIIRFHQHWEDECPYYDTNEFSSIIEYTIGV